MKSLVRNLVPPSLWKSLRDFKIDLLDGYGMKFYSQHGEDMVLRKFLEKQQKGFYIDVGSHHPKRFSNTYFFYKQGWSGINIDAMPGSMAAFEKYRPRDINLEVAISNVPLEMTLFIFNDFALNTFDEAVAHQRIKDGYNVVKEQKITTQTLKDILSKNLPVNTPIDFLSVDVEGLDLEVLISNDWQHFRPQYILVETVGLTLAEISQGPIYQFMTEQHYALVARTYLTSVFMDVRR